MKIFNEKKILIAFYFFHLFLSMYSSLSEHLESEKVSILNNIWNLLSFPLFGNVGEFLVYEIKFLNYESLFFINSGIWTLLFYSLIILKRKK